MSLSLIRLQELSVQGFRNLASTNHMPEKFLPGPRFNVLHGDNGAGKSSMLEAIAYALTLESFRTRDTDSIIARGHQQAQLIAQTEGRLLPTLHRVQLSRSEARKIAIDGKRPKSARDWMLRAPTVIFHPGELLLATGGPGHRRDFLDRMLTLSDATYHDVLRRYTEALKSRNRLLKDNAPNEQAIRAYDPLLAASGSVIITARAQLVRKLAPIAESAFAEIFDANVQLRVAFEPRTEAERLADALATTFAKDRMRGHTTEGPHGDDCTFFLGAERVSAKFSAATEQSAFEQSEQSERSDEQLLRSTGSQGQQRLCVLALKLAELELLAEATSCVPIVLLDDVSSELDKRRSKNLFARLQALGGQVFLTTTHPEFVQLNRDRVDWLVAGGVLHKDA